jgi:hypothetical protein
MKVLTWGNKIYNIFIIINFLNIWKVMYDGVYWSTILVTCIDSILKLFSTYFKQFKLNFNHSFQHFQFVISIVQNNYGRLFLHYFLITTTIHFPQILIHSWKIESMVKFIIKYQERKYNNYKVWSMFLYEFHTTFLLITIEHIKNL